MHEYRYVGPHDLLALVDTSFDRRIIRDVPDLVAWIEATSQQFDETDGIVATFIVDTNGELWIANRRSEHVACAGGHPVLAAGEITFGWNKQQIEVTAVTNQSTGYCPEPCCWPAVAMALDRIAVSRPNDFTIQFYFRRCEVCNSINIVKDAEFFCAVCDAELSREWNFAP